MREGKFATEQINGLCQMRGELKPSRRRVLLQIDAKELVYRWL